MANKFEKPKTPEELQEEAVESFEKYAEGELEKMSPEEREKFLKGREKVKRKNP